MLCSIVSDPLVREPIYLGYIPFQPEVWCLTTVIAKSPIIEVARHSYIFQSFDVKQVEKLIRT